MDADNMQIIATDGPTRFLVAPQGEVGPDTMVQVIDIATRRTGPPRPILVVLSQGEWEQYTGNVQELADVIAKVQG